MSKKPTKQELIDHVESLVAKCEELTRERDEARRSVCCSALPSDYKDWKPKDVDFALRLIAAQQGWDCFNV